jgi:polysaccharide biosynthesis transport protein
LTEQQSQQEVLDLRSYLQLIWRRKWIILAIIVVATAGTYFISSRERKTYTATTSIYVQVADPAASLGQTTGGSLTPENLADIAQLMNAQSITNAVGRRLGMPIPAAGAVTITPSTDSDFVTVTTTGHNPLLVARLANTYVSVFLQSRRQSVKAQALADEQTAKLTLSKIPNSPATLGQRQTLQQQLGSYQEAALNPNAGASQINPAYVPTTPTSPKPKRDAIFGGIIGLVLGLVVALCLELLDRRLIRVSTVESLFGRDVLAVLPHVAAPTPVRDDRPVVAPEFAEELRSLRVMLRLSADAEPPRTIMVTSTLPREGKSTVTRDLALVCADSGERVLVIDGDLRHPSMASLFGVSSDQGLVQILRGQLSLSEVAIAAVRHPSLEGSTNGHGPAAMNGDPSLRGSVEVVVHGQQMSNPLALLSSERMVELLKEAAASYDVVLIDTPPALVVADMLPVLQSVDSVLVVARMGQTTREAAKRFTDLVSRLPHVRFSGVVANDMRMAFEDEGYGYYGKYGYGYSDSGSSSNGSKSKATTAS